MAGDKSFDIPKRATEVAETLRLDAQVFLTTGIEKLVTSIAAEPQFRDLSPEIIAWAVHRGLMRALHDNTTGVIRDQVVLARIHDDLASLENDGVTR